VNAWIAMGAVLGALGTLMGASLLAKRRWGLSAEGSRKTVHIGMALVALAFPWLFQKHWQVWLLCGSAILALAASRYWSPVKARLGPVLGDVERPSLGEFYFPAAIGILFTLTHHRPIRYIIPVLLLGFSDAMAALVGKRYGLTPYVAKDGTKSWEGSLAFFTVSYFAVHVPLLLFTDTGRLETLLIATTLALVMTLFEAIAWNGLDNLLIPLMGYAILDTYLRMSWGSLALRLAVTAALVVFVRLWKRRATLNDAALLGAALAGYASFAIGGWHWLIPPLVLFISYTGFTPEAQFSLPKVHNIYSVLSITGPGLFWLLVYHETDQSRFYLPYLTAYAAHLSFSGIARLAYILPDMRPFRVIARCSVLSWLLLMIPYATWLRITRGDMARFFAEAVLVGLSVAAASWAFYRFQPDIHDLPLTKRRWVRQACFALGASLLAFLPQLLR